jgi:hypothetical protein
MTEEILEENKPVVELLCLAAVCLQPDSSDEELDPDLIQEAIANFIAGIEAVLDAETLIALSKLFSDYATTRQNNSQP